MERDIMTSDYPMNPKPKSRWRFVSVIAIIAILGIATVLTFGGWDLRPFGYNFRSQPIEAPIPPPVKK
jgi:hypothetical protein